MAYDNDETTAAKGLWIKGSEPDELAPAFDSPESWGDPLSVSSYLDRCQVNTPDHVVQLTWKHVRKFRPGMVGKVVDQGAGDGRFARYGSYQTYVGYEIDRCLTVDTELPSNARLLNCCAFSDFRVDADVCVGNPPYVRNQQIPKSWRRYVQELVQARTGVSVSGLANAWQYFFLNALARLKLDGLAALIVPFEWVSRPTAKSLREYIADNHWNVYVYRLLNAGFSSVLTTTSITIVDKANRDGKWEFYDQTPDGVVAPLVSPSGSSNGVLRYLRKSDLPAHQPRAKRGLSPGTQKALILTEKQRIKHSLSLKRDVAPCVTSLRHLPKNVRDLNEDTFSKHFVQEDRRCWLIRTEKEPSVELKAYLASVPESERQTKTCLKRSLWWRFKMPTAPSMLFAQGFRCRFPKVVRNTIGAYAVGGVCGIYNASNDEINMMTSGLGEMDLREYVVAYSSGFYKIEINQINALLAKACIRTNG